MHLCRLSVLIEIHTFFEFNRLKNMVNRGTVKIKRLDLKSQLMEVGFKK